MRLVDADAMREEWLENGENEYVYDTNAFLASIDEQPTIEPVPVVHAEWVDGKCSNCGAYVPTDYWLDLLDEEDNYFCYRCGADMRKGRTDERM